MTILQALQLALEHQRNGQLPQAEAIYRSVLAQLPDEVNALHGLANVAIRTNRLDDAERLLRRAIEVAPGFAELHFSLGEACYQRGRHEEAVTALKATLQIKPDHAAANLNLGIVLHALRRPAESIDACRRAIELNPNDPYAHSQLACALLALNRPAEAAQASRAALALDPNHTAATNNLGEALRGLHRLDDAVKHYERALASTAGPPQIMYSNLGIALMMQGHVERAIAAQRRSLELQPDYAMAVSNLLHTLHYSLFSTAASLTAEHVRWAQALESRLTPPRTHPNSRDPHRPLRIGYVSSDFRMHAVEHFIELILAHHDHAHFKITGYSTSQLFDDTTRRLRGYCDRWREIQTLSDDAAAALIATDGIDILVDLTVHTAGNRLGIFARKPAPVQMTYLGYPGTTGLSTMDYRITAAGMDVPGEIEGPEQLLVLPESYFCYQPLLHTPDIAATPARENGFVTFGSFNRLSKINDEVIATWSKLLHAVNGSKLQLMAIGLGEPATLGQVRERFAAHGIRAERLLLEPYRDEPGYYAGHRDIDIALDPFPFNGGTTTLHALWMGVPVITLAGRLPIGRMGLNIITAIGLPELIADSRGNYIAIAADLAANRDRLSTVRAGMRDRLTNSPLMNAPQFTRNLEALYRAAWQKWCS